MVGVEWQSEKLFSSRRTHVGSDCQPTTDPFGIRRSMCAKRRMSDALDDRTRQLINSCKSLDGSQVTYNGITQPYCIIQRAANQSDASASKRLEGSAMPSSRGTGPETQFGLDPNPKPFRS